VERCFLVGERLAAPESVSHHEQAQRSRVSIASPRAAHCSKSGRLMFGGVKTGSALIEHKISAALMRTRPRMELKMGLIGRIKERNKLQRQHQLFQSTALNDAECAARLIPPL